MNKYLVLLFVVLGLTACGKKDERYYQLNPKELQQALKACPNQKPEGLTCQQIEQIGMRMNRLAYQLQYSPQEFGNKILALQQTIAQQQLQLKKDGTDTALKSSLEKNEHDLTDYLAVVKWLESPES